MPITGKPGDVSQNGNTEITESFENILKFSSNDVKVIRDSKTIVDNKEINETFITTEPADGRFPQKHGRRGPEDYPAAGKPSRNPQDTSENFQFSSVFTSSDIKVAGESQTIEDNNVTNQIFDKSERYDMKSYEEPIRRHPEDYPAAGKPTSEDHRSPDQYPSDKFFSQPLEDESPEKHGRRHPEDYPAAGKSTTADRIFPQQNPRDETPEKPGRRHPEDYPAAGKSTTSDRIFSQQNPRDKIPEKPGRRHPEDYPAAGKSTTSDRIFPQQTPRDKSPENPGKRHPEDYPAAGKSIYFI